MILSKWSDFKSFVDAKSLSIQWVDLGSRYLMAALDGAFRLEYSMAKDDKADQQDFENNYKSNGNKIIEPKSANLGAKEVSIHKPEGSSATKVTHDWTDKTTWHQNATKVTDEVLTLDTGTTYQGANQNWINLVSGKVYEEDVINSDGEYTVEIKVDDVVQNNGYTVDYVNGKITFDSAPGGTVKATYYYAGSSVWTLKPDLGKMLLIEHSEIQFSKNVVVTDHFYFDVYVYNPNDLPNKMLYKRITYKNERDILNSSNLGYTIPKFGNLANDVIILPFNYVTLQSLKSSQGAELRVSTKNDNAITGEFATATFYVISKGE